MERRFEAKNGQHHRRRKSDDCHCEEKETAVRNTPVPLDGQNCIACAESKSFRLPSKNLNDGKLALSCKELCCDLKKPLNLDDGLIPGSIQLIPDPVLSIPPGVTAVNVPTIVNPIDLTGKRVLIIGASKGIGKATAERFYAAGCEVIGTSRHPECYGDTIYNFPLEKVDIRSSDSVLHFAEKLFKRIWPDGRLDILVLAAGIGWAGPLAYATGDDLTNIYDLLVSGYQRVVYQVLPCMQNTPDSRIVAVGCWQGSIPVAGAGGYSMAKRALQFWTEIHQAEASARMAADANRNEPFFTLIEPAPVQTSLGLYEVYTPQGAEECNGQIRADRYVQNRQNMNSLITPVEVAGAIYRIIISPTPATRYVVDNGIPFNVLGQTITSMTSQYNGASGVDNMNDIAIPIAIANVNEARAAKSDVYDAYCGPGTVITGP